MDKRRLTQEEIDSIFSLFEFVGLRRRSPLRQSRIFLSAYLFVNIYAFSYVLYSSLFPQRVLNAEAGSLLAEEFGNVAQLRSGISLILLCLFNFSFFFTGHFRFIALVGFSFLLNASLEISFLFAPYFELSQFSIPNVFFFLRPLGLAAILACIFSYDPDRG